MEGHRNGTFECCDGARACPPGQGAAVREGNFLRAFVDYMIDIANEKSDFNGSVALVKPIQMGTLFPAFKEQDYRYTVMLRGLVDGQSVEQTRVVTSVSDAVDAYADYARYADYAVAVAALHRQQHDRSRHRAGRDGRVLLCPPKSYPGKLTKFLFERAEAFDYAQDKGLIILPVELIDDNGIMLKKCVKALAKQWALGEKFEQWLETACVFTSTLVDRIVTGYPRGEDQAIWEKLGYQDNLLDTAEPFGLWVIESPATFPTNCPCRSAGCPSSTLIIRSPTSSARCESSTARTRPSSPLPSSAASTLCWTR